MTFDFLFDIFLSPLPPLPSRSSVLPYPPSDTPVARTLTKAPPPANTKSKNKHHKSNNRYQPYANGNSKGPKHVRSDPSDRPDNNKALPLSGDDRSLRNERTQQAISQTQSTELHAKTASSVPLPSSDDDWLILEADMHSKSSAKTKFWKRQPSAVLDLRTDNVTHAITNASSTTAPVVPLNLTTKRDSINPPISTTSAVTCDASQPSTQSPHQYSCSPAPAASSSSHFCTTQAQTTGNALIQSSPDSSDTLFGSGGSPACPSICDALPPTLTSLVVPVSLDKQISPNKTSPTARDPSAVLCVSPHDTNAITNHPLQTALQSAIQIILTQHLTPLQQQNQAMNNALEARQLAQDQHIVNLQKSLKARQTAQDQHITHLQTSMQAMQGTMNVSKPIGHALYH